MFGKAWYLVQSQYNLLSNPMI